MADVKISDLPLKPVPVGTDLFELEGGGVSNSVSLDDIAANMPPITTGRVSFGDADFYIELTGGNPIIRADAGDYLAYIRGTDLWETRVGGAVVAYQSGTLAGISTQLRCPAVSFDDGVNALNEYEEGTFTPSFRDNTNTAIASLADGRYVRIGDMVHYMFRITLTDLNGANTNFRFAGLPFSTANDYGTASFANVQGMTITSGVSFGGFAVGSSLFPTMWDATGGTRSMLIGDITNVFQCTVSGQYQTS